MDFFSFFPLPPRRVRRFASARRVSLEPTVRGSRSAKRRGAWVPLWLATGAGITAKSPSSGSIQGGETSVRLALGTKQRWDISRGAGKAREERDGSGGQTVSSLPPRPPHPPPQCQTCTVLVFRVTFYFFFFFLILRLFLFRAPWVVTADEGEGRRGANPRWKRVDPDSEPGILAEPEVCRCYLWARRPTARGSRC